MNTRPDPAFQQAIRIARHRALIFGMAGLVIGSVMLALSSEFVALSCIVLAALTLASALSCAWVAVSVVPQAANRAGMLGGVVAAIGYAMPFVAYFTYRVVTLDTTAASRMAGEMNAAQTTSLMQQGIFPGLDYFRGQFISLAAGYLFFALAFGVLLGVFGGLLARRSSNPASANGVGSTTTHQ